MLLQNKIRLFSGTEDMYKTRKHYKYLLIDNFAYNRVVQAGLLKFHISHHNAIRRV